MHEYTLMNDLMKKIVSVATEQGAKKVVSVKFKLGSQSHISPDHFKEHYDEAAAGTVAEGSECIVQTVDDWNDPMIQEVMIEDIEIVD